jgi:putative Ca2+/H+ antiporter (TMEM165/GDT1 family)
VLAARFRRPLPIIAGILVATVLNHALAAAAGSWLQSLVDPAVLRWGLAVSFLAMAAWTLVPDKLDDDEVARRSDHGVFLTTAFAFFLAEMGDKTQLATVALAAQQGAMLAVVAGTTLGMMLANVPVVLFGHRAADRLPLVLVRRCAAALFLVLGLLALAHALGH